MKRSTEKEVCPQEIPPHFPVKAPEYYNFGYDVVDEWARRDRNKLAMIWANQKGEEKRFTFHDMSKLSNQAANLLIKLGITAGDRVFLMLPRLPEWWIFSLALIKLGAVQCPSPTLLTSQDIQHRIRYGKFKMVITDSETLTSSTRSTTTAPRWPSGCWWMANAPTGSATGLKSPVRTARFRATRSRVRSKSGPVPARRCC